MHLSDEKITKFQALYKQRFGVELPKEESAEQYVKLVRLVQLVYKPVTKEQHALLMDQRAAEQAKKLNDYDYERITI
jgi:hypothetical protein